MPTLQNHSRPFCHFFFRAINTSSDRALGAGEDGDRDGPRAFQTRCTCIESRIQTLKPSAANPAPHQSTTSCSLLITHPISADSLFHSSLCFLLLPPFLSPPLGLRSAIHPPTMMMTLDPHSLVFLLLVCALDQQPGQLIALLKEHASNHQVLELHPKCICAAVGLKDVEGDAGQPRDKADGLHEEERKRETNPDVKGDIHLLASASALLLTDLCWIASSCDRAS